MCFQSRMMSVVYPALPADSNVVRKLGLVANLSVTPASSVALISGVLLGFIGGVNSNTFNNARSRHV